MKFNNSFAILFFLIYLLHIHLCIELTTDTLFKIREKKLLQEKNKIESFLKSIQDEEDNIKNFIGSEKIKSKLPNESIIVKDLKKNKVELTKEEKIKIENEAIEKYEKHKNRGIYSKLKKLDQDVRMVDNIKSAKTDELKENIENDDEQDNRIFLNQLKVKNGHQLHFKRNRKLHDSSESKLSDDSSASLQQQRTLNKEIFGNPNQLYKLMGNKLRINTQLLSNDEKKVLTE